MTKVYVMSTCPDCFEVKARLSDNPDFEIIDIGEHVRNLKAFIRLHDASPAFDPVKAERWTVRESLQYAQEPCPADLHSRTAG